MLCGLCGCALCQRTPRPHHTHTHTHPHVVGKKSFAECWADVQVPVLVPGRVAVSAEMWSEGRLCGGCRTRGSQLLALSLSN